MADFPIDGHICISTCNLCRIFPLYRESALAEMGIAIHKGETVGVFQPMKVS